MSGPKGGSYRVIDAAELARRERERARSLAHVARDELLEGLAAAEEDIRRADLDVVVPAQPGWPGDDAETRAYLQYVADAERAVREVRRGIAEARRIRRTQQVRDALGSTDVETAARGAETVLPEVVSSDGGARRTRDAVQRIVERLRDDVLPADREQVDRSLDRVAAATSDDEVRRWEVELRHAVEEANRGAAALDQEVERARQLLADLRASTVEPPLELDAGLSAVIARRSHLSEALVAAVREAVTAATAAADASFVTAAVTDSLQEMGYELGPAFDSALVEDGVAHFRRRDPRWSDHGIRVRLDGEQGGLLFHVVRASDVEALPTQDVELEEEWCADLPVLVDGLSRQGVDLRISSRAAPGELAVAPVPRSSLEADEHGTHSAPAQTEADVRRAKRRLARRQPKERGR
ncbi:MAG: hypothetical protein EA388_14330 [Nitriliruptor sp.]|nr:MAG: hypothetical protein EA388_14330 [Nitriliruptor sp.]